MLFLSFGLILFFLFSMQQKASSSFCSQEEKRQPVLIKPSYFSLKIISVDLHQELEINLEESCKEGLPKTNYKKLLNEHLLWNMLGGLVILTIASFKCTKEVFIEPEDHQGSFQIPKQ